MSEVRRGELDIRHVPANELTLKWLTEQVLDKNPVSILISYEQGYEALHGMNNQAVRVIWTAFRGIPICVAADRIWGQK